VFGYLQQTSPADQEKATRLVEAFECKADERTDDGAALWHGWAVHQAFLLGVIYARRCRKGDGRRRGTRPGGDRMRADETNR
jgi:hypothetical protein